MTTFPESTFPTAQNERRRRARSRGGAWNSRDGYDPSNLFGRSPEAD